MILSDVVTVSISTNTTPTFGQSRNVTLISNSAKPPSVEFTINVRQPLITASHFSGHRNSDKALVGGCDKPAFSFISTDSVFHPNLCNTLRTKVGVVLEPAAAAAAGRPVTGRVTNR